MGYRDDGVGRMNLCCRSGMSPIVGKKNRTACSFVNGPTEIGRKLRESYFTKSTAGIIGREGVDAIQTQGKRKIVPSKEKIFLTVMTKMTGREGMPSSNYSMCK